MTTSRTKYRIPPNDRKLQEGLLGHPPQYWLDKAEEARVKSETMVDPVCRAMLEDIANSYEQVAHRVRSKSKEHPYDTDP